MYDKYFERVEEKYVITNQEKELLLDKIKDYIQEDKFFKSEIHNIYFDTEHSDLIINSLDKPVFKDKIRVRSYGVPSLEDDVFLELKVKYKGVVGKRRTKIKLSEYYHYLQNSQFERDDQILKEIDYYFKHYHLKPAIYIAYDRVSYVGLHNPELRITFDYHLRSRRENLNLDQTVKTSSYFDQDQTIMEIKTIEAMPLWLVRILSEMKIMPTNFSKYGKIYEKENQQLSEQIIEKLKTQISEEKLKEMDIIYA